MLTKREYELLRYFETWTVETGSSYSFIQGQGLMRKCLSRKSKIVQWSLSLHSWPDFWWKDWKNRETVKDAKETPKNSLISKHWAPGLFTHSIKMKRLLWSLMLPTTWSSPFGASGAALFFFFLNQEQSYALSCSITVQDMTFSSLANPKPSPP